MPPLASPFSRPGTTPLLLGTLASTAMLSGLSTTSLLTVPLLALPPETLNSTLVQQFTVLHRKLQSVLTPSAFLTGVLFFYATWKQKSLTTTTSTTINTNNISPKTISSITTAVSGTLTFVLIPLFTRFVLDPTRLALTDMLHYRDIERADGQEERDLLNKWARLNGIRAGLAGLAAALGTWVLVV